jgi:hypothetical protein
LFIPSMSYSPKHSVATCPTIPLSSILRIANIN